MSLDKTFQEIPNYYCPDAAMYLDEIELGLDLVQAIVQELRSQYDSYVYNGDSNEIKNLPGLRPLFLVSIVTMDTIDRFLIERWPQGSKNSPFAEREDNSTQPFKK